MSNSDLHPLAPLAAEAHQLARQHNWAAATLKLQQLIHEITQQPVTTLNINHDQYSLNSLNGFVTLDNGQTFFFKYHHEEGEEGSIQEYYRAELLRQHGFPVDVPLYASGEPGRQILLYQRRQERRLADVCRDIESQQDWQNMAPVIRAQQDLDKLTLARTLTSLAPASIQQVTQEPIHQLFYHRLVSSGDLPGFGGRVKQFYVGKMFQLGEVTVDWDTLCELKWEINGITYPHTLKQLLAESAQVLNPQALSGHGGVVAHGDAHNANVWYNDAPTPPELILFDPAFAGEHIPALLAEIKATFHNIFAHPLWLYEPDQLSDLDTVRVSRTNETIQIQHPWQLSPLRQAFLDTKTRDYWQPLLRTLYDSGSLPDHWQRIIRLGLFCCPTLVMDLSAGGKSNHTPTSSALGFAIAIMLGSPGDDDVERWISQLLPNQHH